MQPIAKLTVAGATLLAALSVTVRGDAGESFTATPYCTVSSTGAGSCSGTMTSFRSSSDPTAEVMIGTIGNYVEFFATLDGKNYSCAVSGAPSAQWLALISSPSSIEFDVGWGTNGVCSSLWISNATYYE